jgi:hypothetical protein
MRILLAGMMALLLLRAPETMAAAEAACALFVRSVMPGLFPYLTLSQMLVSRCGRDMHPGLLMLLGWCGGSPTGAGDAGQPSAPGTEGAGGLLRDDEPDVPAGDNRKLAEQPNRGGNCAAERAGGRLLRGAIGKTVDEGYIR